MGSVVGTKEDERECPDKGDCGMDYGWAENVMECATERMSVR